MPQQKPSWAAPPLEEMVSKVELEAVEYDVRCPDCGTKMTLRFTAKHDKFKRSLGGRPNKKTTSVWYGCPKWPDCKGSHGAHPNGKPLGIPANKETKAARIRAHAAFDYLWQDKDMPYYENRSGAYAWITRALDIEGEDAHIAKFDEQQCEQLVAAMLIEFNIDANDLV